MKLQAKFNKAQLCINCLHICKQHLLKCVNISETVSISMWLGFSSPFHFEVSCTNQLLILLIKNEREHDLVVSKKTKEIKEIKLQICLYLSLLLRIRTTRYQGEKYSRITRLTGLTSANGTQGQKGMKGDTEVRSEETVYVR